MTGYNWIVIMAVTYPILLDWPMIGGWLSNQARV